MKRIAIIQPGFLPWLGYYEQMARADVFIHFDDVQYTRKDWRNRNRLKSPDGIKTLTVPVEKHDYGRTPINRIRVSYAAPWNEKMLQQIAFWYRQAAFFEPIYTGLRDILMLRFEYLVDLNYALNEFLREQLGITTPQFKSADLPDKPRDKNEKIMAICRHHHADLLYDGKAAQDFLDTDLFKKNGLSVIFQDYRHSPYRQLWGGFVSHLSVLDLLLNCGPESRKILLASPVAAELEKTA